MALLTYHSLCIVSAPSSAKSALGSHGSFQLRQNIQNLQQLFAGVYDQLEIEVDGQRIIMNHYPLLTWPHAFGQHPTWQLFGHVHLRKGITGSDAFIVEQCCRPTQYEVGVDLNGYRPVSFHQLQERIDFQIKNKCNVLNWLNYE